MGARTHFLGTCFVVAALSMAAMSLAALSPARVGAQTDEQRAETQRLFAAGVRAAREGHWDEARQAFEQAYAIVPNPTILVNLAAARTQLGQTASAYRAYQAVLRDPAATAAHREVATSALAELELLVPRVRVALDGWRRGDRLELDGEVQEDFDSASVLRVDEGEHTVVVVRGDRRLAETTFAAEVGSEQTVRIVLPDDALVPMTVVQASTPPPASTELGPILYAVGIPALVAGLGLGATVIAAYAVDGSCAESVGVVCAERWRVPLEGGVAWGVVAGVLTVAGVGLIIGGATAAGPADESDAPRVSAMLGVGADLGQGGGRILVSF